MLDVGDKKSVPSSSVLIRDDQRQQCCLWRANRWIQRKAEDRTQHPMELMHHLVSLATCPVSPTLRSFGASLTVVTFEVSCWKRRTRTCVQRSMPFMSLGPGRLATRYSTSPMPPAPDCLGTSIGWWRCCALSSGIVGRSPCDLPVNRLRKKVPACGPRRLDLQAGTPTHSGAVDWQKANPRRRRFDVPK